MHPTITEHDIQSTFFDWVRILRPHDARLNLVFAVPNAQKLLRHARNSFAFYRSLRAEGFTPGVTDVIGLVPNKDYHGFIIEFKRPGGKLSDEQKLFMQIASILKFNVCVAFSANDAISFVSKHLNTDEKMLKQMEEQQTWAANAKRKVKKKSVKD